MLFLLDFLWEARIEWRVFIVLGTFINMMAEFYFILLLLAIGIRWIVTIPVGTNLLCKKRNTCNWQSFSLLFFAAFSWSASLTSFLLVSKVVLQNRFIFVINLIYMCIKILIFYIILSYTHFINYVITIYINDLRYLKILL